MIYQRIYPGSRHLCLNTIAHPYHKESLECPYVKPTQLDHHQFCITAGREIFLTAEPYNLTFDELNVVNDEIRKLGLKIGLSGRSLYYPGRTFLIVIAKIDSRIFTRLSNGAIMGRKNQELSTESNDC